MCRANILVSHANVTPTVAFNVVSAHVPAFAQATSASSAPVAAQVAGAPLAAKATQAGIIFANRYKTKLCRQYSEDPVTGEPTCSCPYKKKCMFAHARDELRTPEMNLAEGLVTKEDIRAFTKRCKALKAQQAEMNSTEDNHHQQLAAGAHLYHSDIPTAQAQQQDVVYHRSTMSRSQSSNADSDHHGCSSASSSHYSGTGFIPIECPNHRRPFTVQEIAQGYYTHSPYGSTSASSSASASASAALGWEYSADCGCNQCLNHWHSDAKLDCDMSY